MKKGKGSMKKIYYLSDMLNFDLDHDPFVFCPYLFSLFEGIRSLGSDEFLKRLMAIPTTRNVIAKVVKKKPPTRSS